MTFCPDFETLDAMMITCKATRGAFLAHPNSIVTAVAHNALGPLLPEALDCLREKGNGATEGSVSYTEADAGARTSVNAADKPALRRNACVVRKLERFFFPVVNIVTSICSSSILMCDFPGTKIISRPPAPSMFRRAMYRVILYTDRSGFFAYNKTEIDGIGHESAAFDDIRAERLAILDCYPTADLREIHSVLVFLKQTVDWILQDDIPETIYLDDPNQVYDICIAAGPALVLRTYDEHNMDAMAEHCPLYKSCDNVPLFAGFFSIPLAEIWRLRKVSAPPEGHAHLSSILDSHVVLDDLDCSMRRVNSPANMDPCHLGALQASNLSRAEPDALNAFLRSQENSHAAMRTLIREIFRDVDRLPLFCSWREDDALCKECLYKIVRAHAHMWLFHRRVPHRAGNGWVPPGECWYKIPSVLTSTPCMWSIDRYWV
ncbi:hypothetical protein C8R43DRAFT_1119100 [Mycena crocata]|nr:hypothetical protein C8R43DRAFT_1119100 [Mycena crocata]